MPTFRFFLNNLSCPALAPRVDVSLLRGFGVVHVTCGCVSRPAVASDDVQDFDDDIIHKYNNSERKRAQHPSNQPRHLRPRGGWRVKVTSDTQFRKT